MKTLYKATQIVLILAVLFTAMSCEKVIEIDLNSSDPALVAEGLIELNKPAWIKLSYTTDYFNLEEPSYLENAVVTLTSSNGQSEVLSYHSFGNYSGTQILGNVNDTYTMNIEKNDVNISAESMLYSPVEIYDVSFEPSDEITIGKSDETEMDTSYTMTIKFSDDPLVENYYMVNYTNNGGSLNDEYTLIYDDHLVKNDTIEYEVYFSVFYKGDYSVTVYSIDDATYTYYSQLNDLGGGGMGSSTPYNPQSNFGNNIMGYFVAWSSSKTVGELK